MRSGRSQQCPSEQAIESNGQQLDIPRKISTTQTPSSKVRRAERAHDLSFLQLFQSKQKLMIKKKPNEKSVS
jgi:hypothetical protein